MENTLNKKYGKIIVYFLILAFGIVTYSLDLNPGGYELDLFSDEQSFLLTKKDIMDSKQYKIEKTDESILKILLVDNEIKFLKGFWLTGISVFAIWFIYNSSQFEKNKKKPAIIISSIYLIFFVIAIYVYMERLNFMNSVIEGLIG